MFFKKYLLVLILSFLAVIMFFIKINYQENNISNNNIETKIIENNTEINKLLPYYGNNFVINNIKDQNILYIKTNSENKEELIKEMENFFKENNLDINKYKFVFEN